MIIGTFTLPAEFSAATSLLICGVNLPSCDVLLETLGPVRAIGRGFKPVSVEPCRPGEVPSMKLFSVESTMARCVEPFL